MAQPIGASVAYTDPYLLWAVVCKALSPLLPATFQYFGWANLLNFFLQGVFAWRLLQLFEKRVPVLLLGSGLFVLSPILLERTFRHSALGAQWLVLWALGLYFSCRRTGKMPWLQWGVLCCLAPVVHAYFLPMILAVFAASWLEYTVKYKKLLCPVLYVGLCGACSLAVCLGTGVLMLGGGNSSSGYGRFSMNLNALFNPSRFNYLAGKGSVLHWSAFLPVLAQEYHNYDGFNYLGLGILVMLAVIFIYAVYRMIRAMKAGDKTLLQNAVAFCKSHFGLLLACFGCTLFAVSNVVYWFDTALFTVPLPSLVYRVASFFRSSGRMFYPVHYLIMLSVFVFLARRLSGKAATAALAALVLVQAVDMAPVLQQKHSYFAAYPIVEETEFNSSAFQYFAENYDHVVCLSNLFDYRLAAGLIRYNQHVQSNLIFFNRGDYTLVEAIKRHFLFWCPAVRCRRIPCIYATAWIPWGRS